MITVLTLMLLSGVLEVILQIFPQMRPMVTQILSALVEIVGNIF